MTNLKSKFLYTKPRLVLSIQKLVVFMLIGLVLMVSISCRPSVSKKYQSGEITVVAIERASNFPEDNQSAFYDDTEIVKVTLRFTPLQPKMPLVLIGGHAAILTDGSERVPATKRILLTFADDESDKQLTFPLFFEVDKGWKFKEIRLGEEFTIPTYEEFDKYISKWVKISISGIERQSQSK